MKALYKIWFLLHVLFLYLRHGKRVIVLERTGGLGDVICCIPVYRALKQKYPEHLVLFATSQSLAGLLRNCAEIDAVYGVPSGMILPKEKAAWLVDKHYEPHASDESSRVGQKLHLAHVFLKDCGLPVSDWQPRISIPVKDMEAVTRLIDIRPGEPVIAIHTGRTWPVRELPEESWREIIKGLKQNFPGRIVHFCSTTTLGDNHLAVHQFEGVQLLPNNLDVMTVAAILSRCRLLVGIDSGLLHLAGTVGTPMVGIFGAVNPQFRLPWETPAKGVYVTLPCSFCHHENPIKHWQTGCPNDIRCMKEISAVQVIEAAADQLRQSYPVSGI